MAIIKNIETLKKKAEKSYLIQVKISSEFYSKIKKLKKKYRFKWHEFLEAAFEQFEKELEKKDSNNG